MTFSCRLCDSTYDDFYDCKSHVYTTHGGNHCGIAEDHPEQFINEGEAN